MVKGAHPLAVPPSPADLAGYDRNDYGNGLRLIRLAGGRIEDDGRVDASASTLLFLHGSGWVGFNGKHWDRTFGEDLARRMAHGVARALRGEVAALMAEGAPAKEVFKFVDHAGSAGATSAMLRQAQSYLTVEITAFDRDPLALNCGNGTLKLRVVDGKLQRVLRAHDPADRITKICGVDYDAKARAPLFEGVHADSFPDAVEGRYFQRTCGYGATGLTREQAFFLNQGKGRDGKSTLLDACRKALGTYAETGDVLTFLEGAMTSGSGPSPDLVKLSGDVRFVVLSEPKRGAAWNESRLKSWTSGSPIQARDLNAKPFSFKPVGKLFVECNPFPKPRGDDDGFWRRIKPVLFRRQVPKSAIDQELPDKIERDELPGILNWLLDGAADWLCGGEDGRGGLRAPASLDKVVDDYRKQSSPMGEWLTEFCITGPEAKGCEEGASFLYKTFKAWAEEQGQEKIPAQRSFGDFLTNNQIMPRKDGQGNVRRGPVRLKTESERAAEWAAGARPGDPSDTSGAGEGSSSASGVWGEAPGGDIDFEAGDDPFGGGFGSGGDA